MPGQAAKGSVAEPPVVLMEDFEAYEPGAYPGEPWGEFSGGRGAAVTENEVGGRAFGLEGAPDRAAVEGLPIPSEATKVMVEFDVLVEQMGERGSGMTVSLADAARQGLEGEVTGGLYLSEDGSMFLVSNGGQGAVRVGEWVFGQGHRVKVLFDLTDSRMWVWVDGELGGSGIEFNRALGTSEVTFAAGAGWVISYDNVMVGHDG